MRYDINLVDNKSFVKLCSWNSPTITNFVTSTDNLHNLFDVSISIGDYSVSEFTNTLKVVVMDLMINQRLIMKGVEFNYSISDTPVFRVSHDHSEVVFSFFDRQNEREVKIRESIDKVDAELSVQVCHGLNLMDLIESSSTDKLFREVQEDLRSENRRHFFIPK